MAFKLQVSIRVQFGIGRNLLALLHLCRITGFFRGVELFLVDDLEPLIHVVLEDFVVRVAGQQAVSGAGCSG